MIDRARILGAWTLEACEATDDAGASLLPLGPSPAGLLVYDASGTMSVTIMRRGRASFAAADILAGTADEKARAVDGYLSYAGRWSLEGSRVRHHVDVSLFPNWVGTTQERNVVLDGDVLVLSTDPVTFGERTRVARMRWRRALAAAQPSR